MWFCSLAEGAADNIIDRSILPTATAIHPNETTSLHGTVSKFVRENPYHAVVQSIKSIALGSNPNNNANIEQLKNPCVLWSTFT
jgi:hypothetical protein